MDSRQIEQLLEKYWNCETSLEEETQLRDYFQQDSIPPQWKETAELFKYFEGQKESVLGVATDERIIKEIKKATVPTRKLVNLTYMSRIAAGLIVVVAAVYFIRQEVRKSHPMEDTYSDPKLAFEETKRALMMISKGFGKGKQEATKINMFNDAEEKVQGKQQKKKESGNI